MEKKKNNSPNQTDNKWWRPFWTSYYSPEELYEEAMKYFKYCDDTLIENSYGKKVKTPKTISGLGKWLWVSKNYISSKAKEDGYSGMIEYIRWIVENDIELNAMLWFYNPTIASKNLSANFDWRDKTEVENKISWELKTEMSENQLWLIANRILNGKRSDTSNTTTE